MPNISFATDAPRFVARLNRLRANRRVSLVARSVARPLERTAEAIAVQLRRRVWINGGRVTYDGLPLDFPADVGISIASLIYWSGLAGYEPETWMVLRQLIEMSDHFVDVGSSIGLFSVLAERCHPGIAIDAFEPVPGIHRVNLAFHRANGITPDGRVHPLACSDTDGSATLFLPVDAGAVEDASAATLRASSWQSRKAHKQFSVETIRLDTFFARHPPQGRVAIKIDVEDHEAAVLAGARDLLHSRRPLLVCEILPRPLRPGEPPYRGAHGATIHGNRPTADILADLEYSPFAITHSGLFRYSPEDLAEPRPTSNFLCVPDELLPGSRGYLPIAEVSRLGRLRP